MQHQKETLPEAGKFPPQSSHFQHKIDSIPCGSAITFHVMCVCEHYRLVCVQLLKCVLWCTCECECVCTGVLMCISMPTHLY